MGRSKWKFFYISTDIYRHYKRVQFLNFKKIKPIIVYNRNSFIFKNIEKAFIHKGNMFITFLKTKYNLYTRFGNYSFTRRPYYYKIKKK